MRVILLLLQLFSVYGVHLRNLQSLTNSNQWLDFVNFQNNFNKKYESFDELEKRFNIFRENFHTIMSHNMYKNNFTMAVNQFADLTSDEFKYQYISGLKSVGSGSCKTFSSDASAPDTFNWIEKGAVTSVKDQGQCGSCWTFSATGAIEGAWAIAKGQLIDLSEQELVDCATGLSYGSHGCNGGQMDGAFKFVIEHGQCALSSYPYTAVDGTCKTCSPVAHISSCYDVAPNDQLSLKVAVSKQPVSIAIEADTKYFQFYSSGVLTSSTCGTNLDHGVLIVGYGEESGQKYWLVKNSWGTSWGDHGYVKIARSDSTNDKGICGIAMMPSYPVV